MKYFHFLQPYLSLRDSLPDISSSLLRWWMGLNKTYRIQWGAICVTSNSGHQGMIYHFNCFRERRRGKWSRLRFITVDGTDTEVRQMEIWIICRKRSYVRQGRGFGGNITSVLRLETSKKDSSRLPQQSRKWGISDGPENGVHNHRPAQQAGPSSPLNVIPL